MLETIVQHAGKLCGTSFGLLTLVDDRGAWVETQVGWPFGAPLPFGQVFADIAASPDGVVELPDNVLDAHLASHRLATGLADIRFLAGAPLILANGERGGALCVADPHRRHLSEPQRLALSALADIVSRVLDTRPALCARAMAAPSPVLLDDTDTDTDAHYRALIDEQAEMVSLASADGTLLHVSSAYARHFGKRPADMIGVSLYDFVDPADREAVRQVLSSVMATGISTHTENRMLGADGREYWVAWTNRVQTDAPQQRLLQSVGRDITQRKQAELALRASEDFLLRTGRVAGVGGWEVDLVRGKLTWSHETRRIHEVDSDYEPSLDGAINFYTPVGRPVIEAAVQRAAADGTAWDLELPLVTARGREIWVRAVGEAQFEAGQAVRLLGAVQDITARRQLEQQVVDSERFLRELTDSLPIRIAYLDDQRRYRFVNAELLRHFGRDKSEVIGRTRAELLPDADDAVIAERARAALAGQAQQFEFEELVAGQTRRFENRVIPDRSDSGEVRGFFVTGIDVTARNAAERALRELTTIFDNTTDFVVQTNWRGQIVYLNPSARRALGLASDAPVTHLAFSEFVSPASQQLFLQSIAPVVKQGAVWVGESTLTLPGRGEVPVNQMVMAHRDVWGRVERYSSVLRDISAAAAARQEVLRQTSTLKSVTEAIAATVAVVDAQLRYRFVNGAFERSCGLTRAQILGRTAVEILGEVEFERRQPWMQRALAGEAVDFSLDYPTRDGPVHLAVSYVPLRAESDDVDGIVIVTQDITRQKREEARLLELALRDPLTGLLNRAGFERGLGLLRQQVDRTGLAVLYIDLDNFKPVNDQHGHPVGDLVLEHFAKRLAALVRPSDLVARLGGDEFAVALAGMRQPAHAQAVAEKVLVAAHTPFKAGNVLVTIGASVGIAFSNDAAPAWRELLGIADAELLKAKAAGKGRQSGAGGRQTGHPGEQEGQ